MISLSWLFKIKDSNESYCDGFIGVLLGISLFSSVLARTPELIMIVVAFFVGASFLKGIVETLFDIFK